MRRRLPIGISDFKKIIDGNYAYVDKTMLIHEIVEKGVEVILIPRMRRFGKTLNLSMLQYFFEKTHEDTSSLFTSLDIWKIEKFRTLQGQYPVIFLSLKDIKRDSWQKTFDAFCVLISSEFNRHVYLLEGDLLTQKEKKDFEAILYIKANQTLYEQSLFFLSQWLCRLHNKRVILLIDEYDTPAHAAYIGGYYDALIAFLRNWFSAGLKDNKFLEFGVLTGILRIAKESIFSGLNNISTCSLLNDEFQDKFGFLESEVQALLREYGLSNTLDEMRRWYNGYKVGSLKGVYNPWSVLQCIESKGIIAPYWVNTSENAIMTRLITQGTDAIKKDVEELMKGNVIEKRIEEGVIFADLEQNPTSVWSLLLFSGYLTVHETITFGSIYSVKIPNEEVRTLYQDMIFKWFERSISEEKYSLLLKSLVTGDIDTFSRIFQEFLFTAFSVFDVSEEQPERVYHAFILGVLIGLKDRYEVRSNRESGLGRYDVTLFPKNANDLGIVMEFKKIDRFEKSDLETAVESALKQIEEKQYATELLARGVKRCLLIGLAFEGKNVLIKTR
jgi:hypothetical protein